MKSFEKEMVGKREAQVVTYTLKLEEAEKPATVTVWIDTKTQLPLKRVLRARVEDNEVTMTETFSRLDLKAKIGPKKFELPR
jgi:outer membrane lipoprotein-sorting protein